MRRTIELLLVVALLGCDKREAKQPDKTRDPSGNPEANVLQSYYDAINRRDYETAYASWGSDGPPGHPRVADFAAGFNKTDSVQLKITSVGRIEGAAGSRYVDIGVFVRAFEQGSGLVEYEGSYTLRRSVVPGAAARDTLWHLYNGHLTTVQRAGGE